MTEYAKNDLGPRHALLALSIYQADVLAVQPVVPSHIYLPAQSLCMAKRLEKTTAMTYFEFPNNEGL
jgi:hypothetical protein